MRRITLIAITALIAFSPSCANQSRLRGARMDHEPMLASQDFTLSAGEPSPIGPSLVRVLSNGVCIFTAWGEKPIEVEAAPGEQIPEGDSDFYGMVVSSDTKRQTAQVRAFDLGRPITQVEQVSGGNVSSSLRLRRSFPAAPHF